MTTVIDERTNQRTFAEPTRELTLGQTLDNTVALYPG